jgi:short-subunit dehydrogenase
LFTAQAAGRQMVRFGNRGSIILIASMSGTITNKVHPVFSSVYTDDDNYLGSCMGIV